VKIASRTARPAAAFFLASALTIFWTDAAQGKSIAIDDSGTQALEPAVNLRWQSPRPSRSGGDNLMVGTTTIRVRINVLPWMRRSGRIYLVLPAQQPGPRRKPRRRPRHRRRYAAVVRDGAHERRVV
jgi:hypothetical protein